MGIILSCVSYSGQQSWYYLASLLQVEYRLRNLLHLRKPEDNRSVSTNSESTKSTSTQTCSSTTDTCINVTVNKPVCEPSHNHTLISADESETDHQTLSCDFNDNSDIEMNAVISPTSSEYSDICIFENPDFSQFGEGYEHLVSPRDRPVTTPPRPCRLSSLLPRDRQDSTTARPQRLSSLSPAKEKLTFGNGQEHDQSLAERHGSSLMIEHEGSDLNNRHPRDGRQRKESHRKRLCSVGEAQTVPKDVDSYCEKRMGGILNRTKSCDTESHRNRLRGVNEAQTVPKDVDILNRTKDSDTESHRKRPCGESETQNHGGICYESRLCGRLNTTKSCDTQSRRNRLCGTSDPQTVPTDLDIYCESRLRGKLNRVKGCDTQNGGATKGLEESCDTDTRTKRLWDLSETQTVQNDDEAMCCESWLCGRLNTSKGCATQNGRATSPDATHTRCNVSPDSGIGDGVNTASKISESDGLLPSTHFINTTYCCSDQPAEHLHHSYSDRESTHAFSFEDSSIQSFHEQGHTHEEVEHCSRQLSKEGLDLQDLRYTLPGTPFHKHMFSPKELNIKQKQDEKCQDVNETSDLQLLRYITYRKTKICSALRYLTHQREIAYMADNDWYAATCSPPVNQNDLASSSIDMFPSSCHNTHATSFTSTTSPPTFTATSHVHTGRDMSAIPLSVGDREPLSRSCPARLQSPDTCVSHSFRDRDPLSRGCPARRQSSDTFATHSFRNKESLSRGCVVRSQAADTSRSHYFRDEELIVQADPSRQGSSTSVGSPAVRNQRSCTHTGFGREKSLVSVSPTFRKKLFYHTDFGRGESPVLLPPTFRNGRSCSHSGFGREESLVLLSSTTRDERPFSYSSDDKEKSAIRDEGSFSYSSDGQDKSAIRDDGTFSHTDFGRDETYGVSPANSHEGSLSHSGFNREETPVDVSPTFPDKRSFSHSGIDREDSSIHVSPILRDDKSFSHTGFNGETSSVLPQDNRDKTPVFHIGTDRETSSVLPQTNSHERSFSHTGVDRKSSVYESPTFRDERSFSHNGTDRETSVLPQTNSHERSSSHTGVDRKSSVYGSPTFRDERSFSHNGINREESSVYLSPCAQPCIAGIGSDSESLVSSSSGRKVQCPVSPDSSPYARWSSARKYKHFFQTPDEERDLVLVTESDRFHVHCAILVRHCHALCNYLQNTRSRGVVLLNKAAEDVLNFLCLLYPFGERVTGESVKGVLDVAHYLGCEHVKSLCCDYLVYLTLYPHLCPHLHPHAITTSPPDCLPAGDYYITGDQKSSKTSPRWSHPAQTQHPATVCACAETMADRVGDVLQIAAKYGLSDVYQVYVDYAARMTIDDWLTCEKELPPNIHEDIQHCRIVRMEKVLRNIRLTEASLISCSKTRHEKHHKSFNGIICLKCASTKLIQEAKNSV